MLVLVLSLACGGEKWVPMEVVDRGAACLIATEADALGTVTVDSGECMSSSCDRDEQGSCTATLDGDTITVTSTFSWETATGKVACTDDCGLLSAECTVGPLAAGTYTLVHGSDQQTVTVPTEDDCGPT